MPAPGTADASTRRAFPARVSRAASGASIASWTAQFAQQGWRNWAVARRDSGEFIGFTGLTVPRALVLSNTRPRRLQ